MRLTIEQKNKLKSDLEQERANLTKQLEEIADKRNGGYEVKVPEFGTDETDNAAEVATIANEVAMKEELETKLQQVERALRDMENGAYGTCSNCSSPIASNRLEALPLANLCINCAEKSPS